MSRASAGGSGEELRAQLVREIRQLTGLGASYFRAAAGRVGMNATDVEVVDILGAAGPATAGQLAEQTGLTTGAVTQLLDRLEEAGLVRRERDPEDGRRVVVRLTPGGDAAGKLGPIVGAGATTWDELAAGYDDAQLAVLVEFLRRANAAARGEIARLREAPSGDAEREFSAPLGGLESGRLVVVVAGARLILRADAAMAELYRASFEGPAPVVTAEDGTVTIRYPRGRWLLPGRAGRVANVVLNAAIPWRIEIQGGAADATADLGGLRLAALDIRGGASMVRVTLPEPIGTVPIKIGGGASQVTIARPAGVAARLRLTGWAAGLAFDDQAFEYVGRDTRLQSPDYESAAGRYDIEVSGSASMLHLGAS